MADTPLSDPAGAKRTQPWVSTNHPDFKWTRGADVQATWHRYTGWTPPSAGRPPLPDSFTRPDDRI